jgi:hypothetical protein
MMMPLVSLDERYVEEGTLSVVSNSNSGVVTADLAGTALSLTYLPDQHGMAEITIRATDDSGAYVEDTIQVVVHSVIDAVIDIKPGSDENPIHLGANGILLLAILSTQKASGELEDFDASLLLTVPLASFEFGDSRAGFGRVSPIRATVEDVDADGDMDLVLHFSMASIRAMGAADSVDAVLSAEFGGDGLGADLIGWDAIRMAPQKGVKKKSA